MVRMFLNLGNDSRPMSAIVHMSGTLKLVGKRALTLGFISFVPVFASHALEFDYSVGYEVERSDNIFRVPTNEESELINRLGFDFLLEQEGSTLNAHLEGSIDYAHYAENTSDDEFLPELNILSTWKIRPGTLEWQVENYTRQVAINTAGADTPSNRQTTNVFQTGPDITFRLDSASSLQAEARYGDYYFEDSDSGSTRYLYALRYIRGGSVVKSALNAEYTSVEYESSAGVDFNRLNTYASAEWQRGRNELVANLGWTEVDRDGSQDGDGFLARLLWNHELTSRSTVYLSGSTETTDSGSFIQRIDLSGIGTGGIGFDSPDIVDTKRAEAGYAREGGTWSQAVRAYVIDLDYEDEPNDRDIGGIAMDFGIPLSSTSTITLLLGYSETDWTDLGRDDTDKRASLLFRHFLTPRLRLSAGGGWNDRQSTDPLEEYTDIRLFAGVDYDFPR